MEKEGLNIQFSKRFGLNFGSNILYFLLNIIIGLLLVPFYLDTLGPAAYGLIPLATSITSYVTLVIDAVNASINRHLTIDLQKGDLKQSKITYNTALFGILALSLIMLPVIILLAWIITGFVNIGNEDRITVFVLFALVFGAALIRFMGSSFMTVLFAHNRLDLRNCVNIVNISVQVGLIISFFSIFGPNLYCVGLSYISSAIVSVILAWRFSKKINSNLTMNLALKSKSELGEIGKTSGFLIVTQLGYLFRAQISMIIVNIFVGVIAGAQFSIALTFFTLLEGISGILANQFTPLLYSYCSNDNKKNLVNIGFLIVKLIGIIMVLPIGLICLYSGQILALWVGKEYVDLAPIVCILIIPLVLRLPGNAIYPIVIAKNKVYIAAGVSLGIGAINLILSLLFINYLNLGIYGASYAWFIIMIIEAIVCLIYIALIVKTPIHTYLKGLIPSVIGFILIVFLGNCFNIYNLSSIDFLKSILFGVIIIILYILFARFVFLRNKEERDLIKSALPLNIKFTKKTLMPFKRH